MAIGTPGGKVGCLVGPIIAVFAMVFGVGWFGITEDGRNYLGLFAWFLFGLAVAIASGLIVRWALNRVFRINLSGY